MLRESSSSFTRGRSGHAAARLAAALAFLCPFLAHGWDLGDALLPLRDAETVYALEEARRLVEEGDIDSGLVRLQRLHERIWGRNHIYSDPAWGEAGRYRISRAATDVIVETLRALPPEAKAYYRDEFTLAGEALYTRAMAQGDVELLVRCAELYPILDVGAAAALAAGDLFLERGDLLRARDTYAKLNEESPASIWRVRVQRGLLIASQMGDREGFAAWQDADARFEDEVPGAAAAKLGRPKPANPDPLHSVPALPFTRAQFEWETFPPYKSDRPFYGSRDVHFSRQVCVQDSIASISAFTRILRFDLNKDGKQLGSIPLPRPTDFPEYSEHDPSLRVRPVAEGEYFVSSYVAAANPPEEFFGYDIKIPVPQRGLRGYRGKNLLEVWDTARPRRGRDPLLNALSFNSQPVIVGDRLYALGWRQSGYVNAYVVCLDLATGEALWKTIVVGNQVELTMFGEIAVEPFLGAVLVEDGVVYACTNLGCVTAVRARDGGIQWCVEYPNVDVRPSRRSRGTRRRTPMWDRNPIVSWRDRLFVTPFDSEYAIAVSKESGRILQWSDHAALGPFFLGLHGDHLVFSGDDRQRRLVVVPARDLGATTSYSLSHAVRARPALVRGGIVYTSPQGGLYLRRFEEGRDREQELAPPISARHPRVRGLPREDVRDGAVTVLEDRILVTNAYRIRCFVEDDGIPRSVKEKR